MATSLRSSTSADPTADSVDDVTSLIQTEMDEVCGDEGNISGSVLISVSDSSDSQPTTGPVPVDGDGGLLMATCEAAMDSADIIPEAAMKCGIIPLGSLLASDDEEAYREICERDDFSFDGASESLIDCNGVVDECPPASSPMTSSNILQPHHHPQKQPSPDNHEPLPAEAMTSAPTDEVEPMSVADGSISAIATASSQSAVVEVCAGCRRPIVDRYLLRAVDRNWHEDCLRCSCCDCRLGEVGSTLFTRSNLLLCRRDYLRLFGTSGHCAACSKLIPAFEMIMKAKDNVYHLECFACQRCNQRFCIGDKFYLSTDNRILCEYDHEEERSKMFAAAVSNSSPIIHTSPYSPSSSLLTSSTLPPSSMSPLNHQMVATAAVASPILSVAANGGSASLSSTTAVTTSRHSSVAAGRNGTGRALADGTSGLQMSMPDGSVVVVGSGQQLALQLKHRQMQHMRMQQQQQQIQSQHQQQMMQPQPHHQQYHQLQLQQQQQHHHLSQHQLLLQQQLGAPTPASYPNGVLGCSSW